LFAAEERFLQTTGGLELVVVVVVVIFIVIVVVINLVSQKILLVIMSLRVLTGELQFIQCLLPTFGCHFETRLGTCQCNIRDHMLF
jgi:hypothetical protein